MEATYIEREEDIPLVYVWMSEHLDFIPDLGRNIDIDACEGLGVDVLEVLDWMAWIEFIALV
jgi:hypothetical protein